VHLSFLVQHETLFVPLAAVFQNTVAVDSFSCFYNISMWQTCRRMDRQTSFDSIVHAMQCIASCGKNGPHLVMGISDLVQFRVQFGTIWQLEWLSRESMITLSHYLRDVDSLSPPTYMIGVRLIYIGIETGQIFIAVEIFLFVWNWGTSEVEGQHFPEMWTRAWTLCCKLFEDPQVGKSKWRSSDLWSHDDMITWWYSTVIKGGGYRSF